MAIERIIMVTGSKGGGGKTPVATAVALALHDLGIPVAVCDFNFNNADLYTIFHGTNINQRRQNGYLKQYHISNDIFFRIAEGFWLTKWQSTTSVGLPSTDSMWSKLEEISHYDFPVDTQPRILVVDSNLTLPLICPSLTSMQSFPRLPPVEVFHLWSPSIVLQLDEQERFVKAIDILNRFSPGFEERMTHIFTPRHHQSTGFFGTLSSLTKGEFKISSDINLKQSKPKSITFSEMKDLLFADFLPQLLNFRQNMELDIDQLMSAWLNNIIEQLEKREYRTHNVLLVPTVVHDIALLVEKLSLKPRRTMSIIRQDLGTLYQVIYAHFEEFKDLKQLPVSSSPSQITDLNG